MTLFTDNHQPGRTQEYNNGNYRITAPMDMYIVPANQEAIYAGWTSSVTIARETDEEEIRGGMRNAVITYAETDAGMTVTISNQVWNKDLLELQSGTSTRDWTQIPLLNATYADDGNIAIEEIERDGEAVEIKSNSFGANAHLQLVGLIEDINLRKPVGRFYWIFPNVQASSAWEETYELDNAEDMQEIVFNVLEVPGTSTYGHRVIIMDDTLGDDTSVEAIVKPGGEIVDAYESEPKSRLAEPKEPVTP